MPLFMDVHHLDDGVAMDDVAKAHQADLATQGAHDVELPALLGRRGPGQDLLPRRGARRRGGQHGAPRGARARRRRDLPGPGRQLAGWAATGRPSGSVHCGPRQGAHDEKDHSARATRDRDGCSPVSVWWPRPPSASAASPSWRDPVTAALAFDVNVTQRTRDRQAGHNERVQRGRDRHVLRPPPERH